MTKYKNLTAEIVKLELELDTLNQKSTLFASLDDERRLAILLYENEVSSLWEWAVIADDANTEEWENNFARKQYLQKARNYLAIMSYEVAVKAIYL